MYPAELPPHVRPAPDLPRSAPRCHGVFRSGVPRTAFRGPLPCRSTRAATAAGSHIRQLRLSGRGEREAPRAVGADVLETVARVRPRQLAEREQPHHESNVGRHASTAARARSWPTGRAMVSCSGRDRARGGRRGVLAAPAVAVRGRCRPGSVPQIRRETRIVQPPAVEPGGELAESRGVDAARVRRGGPRDELGRGLGAGAMRGRERAGCAAAGGHVLHDRWTYRSRKGRQSILSYASGFAFNSASCSLINALISSVMASNVVHCSL